MTLGKGHNPPIPPPPVLHPQPKQLPSPVHAYPMSSPSHPLGDQQGGQANKKAPSCTLSTLRV